MAENNVQNNSLLEESRKQVHDVFVVPETLARRDPETQARVNEIIDTYPQDVVERALFEAAEREASDRMMGRQVDDVFEQILAENPELYEFNYETSLSVGLDTEEWRAFAAKDGITFSWKERLFGIIGDDLTVRLVNNEANFGGKMIDAN